MSTTFVKTYPPLPFWEREILRYAGCHGASPDPAVIELMHSCEAMVQGTLTYRVCWQTLPVSCTAEGVQLGTLSLPSRQLSKLLTPCTTAVVFAATIGIAIDRLVSRYSHISPAKALVLQALGAAQIEALCDRFCTDLEAETGLSGVPRFSPGYGDLAIETQRDIFALLGCEKRIGLTLNDSLLMSPTKSVTAIFGLTEDCTHHDTPRCATCPKKDCAYRELRHHRTMHG